MHKLALACMLAIAAGLSLPGGSASAQDGIAGTWLTDEGDSKVEIAATGSGASAIYAGKVVWLKQTTGNDGKPLLDANNADAALRNRPIMGLEILSGFKPAAGVGWAGGTVYSPRNGKRFPAELSLAADGKLEVKVKAGLVSRTLVWTR